MKLKHLLILAFVVLAAIPLFIGLQFLNHQTGEHYRQLFEDHMASLSLIAKQRILSVVDRIEDNTALIASRTQMRISLSLWNTTNDEAHKDKLTKILQDAKFGLDHIKDIQIFDPNGELVATTPTVTAPLPLNQSKVNASGISLQMEEALLVIKKVTPLILDHQVVGYLRLTFFTDVFTNLVRDRTGLGRTGEWLVAIRHESGDALFAVPLKYDHKAAFTRRVSKDRYDVPITQALLGNETVMGYAPDYMGTPVLASTRYLKDLDWGLVAKINEDEVNQLVHRNAHFIYIAELVIVALAILVGILISVYISSPIEKLRSHVDKVSKGSLEESPEANGWREVKELTTHFNFMIQTLRDLNENLQEKVEARTQELFEANQMLEELTIRDPLTNLFNRRYLNGRFTEEIQRAKRYNTPLACAAMDVDQFKVVNDTWGHDTGDDVLLRLATFLDHKIRESDILVRLNGEEFCILLPVCSEKSAVPFLERLRKDIEALEFTAENTVFNITCSFGVAFLDETNQDMDSLLKAAEEALCLAKEAGRNRVVTYDEVLSVKKEST